MGVQDDLESLRGAFPGCFVIAYADLDTRVVLVSSSEGTARRDTLDGLCSGAIGLFAAAEAAGEHDADLVVRSHGGQLEVTLRDPERRGDALCALCAIGTDIDGYIGQARGVLRAMGEEGGA